MKRWWNRPRFDVVEVGLALVLAVVAVLVATRRDPLMTDDVARDLRARYGASRNSQFLEEWIVRDFFQDRRHGFFLDVGASHYRQFNNTFYLETSLGWEGIAVEPLVGFEAEYRRYRPGTKFRPFFASDRSNEQAKMYVIEKISNVSSADRSFTERWDRNVQERVVPTITLDDLLASERVSRIDFLSMDIELAEPAALAGFDIERFAPALVCIEGQPEVRQRILDYFARHGYVLVGKYLRADAMNLYFKPA